MGFGDGQIGEKNCMRIPEKFGTTWVSLEDIMLSDKSQAQRQILPVLTYK